MKIKATIKIEYEVNLEEYYIPTKCDPEQAIQAIELHKLLEAISEIMPWPDYGKVDQVLEIELEK